MGDALDCLAKVTLRNHAFGVDVHPSQKIFAAGLITGQLKVFSWTSGTSGLLVEQCASARPHKDACRAVRFSGDGASVFSVGGDRVLHQRDLTSNKPTWRKPKAHHAPINALTLLDRIGAATGDDDGSVVCWDLRSSSAALKFKENEDYIADLVYVEQVKNNRNTLVAAGGDGHLSVFDLRAGRLWARSDAQEDELLCVALVKEGRKLLCGTQMGTVGIFSWGDFGDVSDRLLGHPASIDCMLAHGEDMVLTGSSDGLIRAVSVHPNKVLGVVGQHGEEATVESMATDSAGEVLVSCAYDQTIRLWDVGYLNDAASSDNEKEMPMPTRQSAGALDASDGDESDGGDDNGGNEAGCQRGKAAATSSLQGAAYDDDAGDQQKRKRPKQLVHKGAAIKLGTDFFADL